MIVNLRRGARRPHTLLASCLGVALALTGVAGCASEADDRPESDPEPRSEQEALPATQPLTGLRVESGTGVRRHPVLVLKLDNTASSSPQLGLSSADLVVEELVEGGVTRLAAFYYSDIPGVVGPVRSMRASDLGIVAPVDATMVTSGAAAQTIARLAKADVPFVTEGSPGFFRESSRAVPYNLMADLRKVAAAQKGAGQDAVRPSDYLPFGPAEDLPAGAPAGAFTARFSDAHTTSWAYRGGGYVNTGSFAAPDDEFPADTVLVLRVEIGDAGYTDPAGNPVPETELVGGGDAQLFHAGRVVKGQWSKAALDEPLELTRKLPQGRQVVLQVPPGHTWIELVPQRGGVAITP